MDYVSCATDGGASGVNIVKGLKIKIAAGGELCQDHPERISDYRPTLDVGGNSDRVTGGVDGILPMGHAYLALPLPCIPVDPFAQDPSPRGDTGILPINSVVQVAFSQLIRTCSRPQSCQA